MNLYVASAPLPSLTKLKLYKDEHKAVCKMTTFVALENTLYMKIQPPILWSN